MLRMRKSDAIWSGSRIYGNLLGKNKLTIIWSDPGFAENFLKLNCYLFGFRLHNNLLGIRKLNVIWSDPGFAVT